MSLLDRLFRKSEQPMSELDGFLSKIDRSQIHARAREVKNAQLRTATAISLLVLEQSGRFTRDLFRALRTGPIANSAAIQEASNFDAAAFETAAFIHYSLLSKHLGSPDDQSDDDYDIDMDDADEADPYFVSVRDAHHLTGTILNSLVSFSANENIFRNRPIAYSLRGRQQGLVDEGVLIEAIENGAPATLRSRAVNLTLQLPIVVSLNARTFAVTMLPVLEEVARNVVDHTAELGLT